MGIKGGLEGEKHIVLGVQFDSCGPVCSTMIQWLIYLPSKVLKESA